MFVLLPCFSWDNAVVNRRMRCLCKSLLSPFWEPPHTWRCWTMWLILCLTVWGTAIVLSRASAPSYPHQQNTSDHFSTSFPTHYFMAFWVNMRYFNEQLPPWAPGAQSFWGLWEVPWNCPQQGTRKLAYFSTKSCLLVEADLPWPSGGEL